MKKLIVYIILVFIAYANTAFAQDKGYEYVVTLKNGITLRGQFIKKDANGFITLGNPEKGLLSINPAEISFMQREELPANAPYALQSITPEGDFGFQFAPGVMIGMTDETENGFQMHGVALLWLNNTVAVGAGAGFERVNHSSWLPFFGQLRIDAGVPFIAVDLGYSSLISNESYFRSGGLMAAAELGFKFPVSDGLTFFLSTTYRYQRAAIEEMIYALEQQPSGNEIYPAIYYTPFSSGMDYHFLVLSAGVIF